MDVSPLAVESFSYSWLRNVQPPISGLDGSPYTASYSEMDNEIAKAERFVLKTQEFDFDVPTSNSIFTLVYADQLFSNGRIKPVFSELSSQPASDSTDSIPFFPRAGAGSVLKRWRKSTKKILKECCRYIGSFLDERSSMGLIKRSSSSIQRSTTDSSGHWSVSESLIAEAVLYCKRSSD